MQNAILIEMDGKPFATLLVHRIEFLSLDMILDKYSEWSDIDRSKMTGRWIEAIDITNSDCMAKHPVAQGQWP